MTGVPDIEREIFIAASPEAVFRFFVEPAFMARWFGQQHTLDPRPGGIFRVEVSAGNFARGTYTEVIPHRRIAFTWGWEGRADLPPGRSLVEIELVPEEGGTSFFSASEPATASIGTIMANRPMSIAKAPVTL